MHPMNLVRRIAGEMPVETNRWLEISATIEDRDIESVLDSIPSKWMTPLTKQFVLKLVCRNIDGLRNILKDTEQ